MYSAIESFAVQKTLLLTAAQTVLPKKYFNIFRVTMGILNRSVDHRNKFAHGIWGVSQDPDLRDALLLVAPKHFWKMRAQRINHYRQFLRHDNPAKALLPYPNLDMTKVFVYRRQDLVEICEEIERAYDYAHALMNLVDSKPDRRKLVLRWLSAQPPIRQVLEKDRRNREEDRETLRERDRARRLADQQALKRRDAKKEYKAKHAT